MDTVYGGRMPTVVSRVKRVVAVAFRAVCAGKQIALPEAPSRGGAIRGMAYRVEATSVEGFVQQLAVSYVARGYFFYVTGEVPAGKDPANVDRKLLARYGIDISKFARARRKAAGRANLHLIRYQRFFVLLASHGESPFFAEEAAVLRDARRESIRFAGYSVSYRGGHVQVRIAPERYRDLKAYFAGLATSRTGPEMESEFRRHLRFEPYAPVRRQLLCIWRHVNKVRAAAGLEPVPRACLRMFRKIVKPFEPERQAA
jgi:hypothetical protein